MTRFTDRQPPPLPPSGPLDEEERALARALRGLPSATPPPELDARILGASRRAIALAPKPHPHRRGWVWGLSSAAAAVLAVGVLLKMHMQGRDAVIAPPSAAPATTQPAAAELATTPAGTNNAATADAALEQPAAADGESKATEARASRTAAETLARATQEAVKARRDGMAAANSAVPPTGRIAPPGAASGRAGPPPAALATASNAAPQPFPAAPTAAQAAPPPAAPVVTDQSTYISMPAPPPSAAAAKAESHPTPIESSPQPARAKEPEQAAHKDDTAREHVEVAGSRITRVESAPLPMLADDAQLPPTQWIERIRARVNAADREGARESLRRFAARYPDAEIPADLAPLRK